MCKVKNCNRPSFLGGLCGYHALEGWSAARQRQREPLSAVSTATRGGAARRRASQRPASG